MRILVENFNAPCSEPAGAFSGAEFGKLQTDIKRNDDTADDDRFGIYLGADAIEMTGPAAPLAEWLVANARK